MTGEFERSRGEGHGSDILQSAEQLLLVNSNTVSERPTRVKLVMEPDVADTARVVGVST